jgi:phage terminase large subunit-like protein
MDGNGFQLTEKQIQANALLASPATHIMLAGGSRSGKTFLLLRAMVTRALKAPGSRHTVLRKTFAHLKGSIIFDTFPKMMQLCFPQITYRLSKSDWFTSLPGGSEVWFGGLDDKERTEKILGAEYATILLNECSQIPYSSRAIALTRLAQKVTDNATGATLSLKMYHDENPPDKGHWTYRMFKLKQDPETKGALQHPEDYAFMQINPRDNMANISPAYMRILESMSARMRKRFLDGEFRETSPNALFVDETIDTWRVIDDDMPQMLRIVVAVDPSGADDTDNIENDEIGIVVAGLGINGIGYVLEDLTCKGGPATWGKVATDAFTRHSADRIEAEVNYGGAMVKHVIHTARARTPFRAVTASRGKVVRAEPVSALFETGQCRMAGSFAKMEDELYAFTTHGFTGEQSPNRADAMIWAVSDLFPELCKQQEKIAAPPQQIVQRGTSRTSWMNLV